MARKTTKAARNAIEHWNNLLRSMENLLSTKLNVAPEHQADWLRTRSVNMIVGMIEGARGATEAVIMSEKCWYGFAYLGEDGNPLTLRYNEDGTVESIHDHPEFCEWRVRFNTKG